MLNYEQGKLQLIYCITKLKLNQQKTNFNSDCYPKKSQSKYKYIKTKKRNKREFNKNKPLTVICPYTIPTLNFKNK